jgi:hypothetical protein
MNTTPSAGAVADGPDLSVESGETVRLSPNSKRLTSAYKRVYPTGIDEVRALVGLSEASTKALSAQKCCGAQSIPAGLALPDDLSSSETATSRRAKELAVQAAYQYVTSSNPAALAQWKPLVNRYLEVGMVPNIYCLFRDIDIADHGTLIVPASLRALYANNIRIHGSGRLVCEGNISINCVTLQGIHQYVLTPLSQVSQAVRTV